MDCVFLKILGIMKGSERVSNVGYFVRKFVFFFFTYISVKPSSSN
jgi:hypothetical protein